MSAKSLNTYSQPVIIRLNILNKWLLRNSVIFWLIGFVFPHLYILLLTSVIRLKNNFVKSTIFRYLAIFLLIQLLSLLGSLFLSFFSWERFFASLHNITSFLFVFAGINYIYSIGVYDTSRIAKTIFKWIVWLVVIFSILSLTYNIYFSYPGLLSFLGNNKFTIININHPTWHIFSNFPRASVYGIYPNSTGLILTMLYPIQKTQKPRIQIFDTFFLFACFMTGSRIFLVIGVVQVLISSFRSKSMLITILFFVPFILLVLSPYIVELYDLRESSNSQRFAIYQSSIDLMLQTNPILGVGIKPFMEELTLGGHYPLGSHSTAIGYLFKTGIVGGLFVLAGYLFIFIRFIKYLVKLLFTGSPFNRNKFLLESSFILIVLSSLIEDFDAYEPVMLYFGFLIGFIVNKEEKR